MSKRVAKPGETDMATPLKMMNTHYETYNSDEGYVPAWKVVEETGYGYHHVYVDVVLWNRNKDEVRGVSYNACGELQLSNQADANKAGSYGWRIETCGKLDSRNLAKVAKTAAWLVRRLEKLQDDLGRPTTYGQYVAYVSKASGIRTFVAHSKRDGETWREIGKDTIAHEIDYRIAKWHEEHGPRVEAEAVSA